MVRDKKIPADVTNKQKVYICRPSNFDTRQINICVVSLKPTSSHSPSLANLPSYLWKSEVLVSFLTLLMPNALTRSVTHASGLTSS